VDKIEKVKIKKTLVILHKREKVNSDYAKNTDAAACILRVTFTKKM